MKKITHALLRNPGNSFVKAISPKGGNQNIDIPLTLKQHQEYIKYLKSIGLKVNILKADEKLPDGCFVDDAAVIVNDVLILCFSANPKRQGESNAVKNFLAQKFKKIIEIKPPAYLDGGDLLFLKSTLYIGISKRTNIKAVKILANAFQKLQESINVKIVPVTKKVHLKSSVNFINENMLILNSLDISPDYFKGFIIIDVKNKHIANANCVAVNGKIFLAKGSSFLQKKLKKLHISYKEFNLSEFKKAGGGINGLAIFY